MPPCNIIFVVIDENRYIDYFFQKAKLFGYNPIPPKTKNTREWKGPDYQAQMII